MPTSKDSESIRKAALGSAGFKWKVLPEQPKISVVTVSLNQGEFIRANIQSILGQQYPNFEHIIVDGGSTDGTIEILQDYPHLQWSSGPDGGQSEALNKGFAQANGDIVVWLNSDDWLAPEAFGLIIPALRERGVFLAAGARTNRQGEIQEVVPNRPRTWFDLLKYWVPYAWMVQPSIFFRRELLERVRYRPGVYLDANLYYVMDVDLWLRLAEVEAFDNYSPTVCSYFRIYEDNKTGREAAAAQRENSRLFRRHSHVLGAAERRFSVIVPVAGEEADLRSTISSLLAQELPDWELILAGFGPGLDPGKVRRRAWQLGEELKSACIRSVYSESELLLEAFNVGAAAAAGVYLILLQPGDLLPPGFLLQVEQALVYDWVGIVLPLQEKPDLRRLLQGDQGPAAGLTLSGILHAPLFSPVAAVRRVTWLDLGGYKSTGSAMIGPRELLLRALYKSWQVLIDRPLGVSEARYYQEESELFSSFEVYITAKLIVELQIESAGDPFYQVKVEHNNALILPPDLVTKCRALLASAPPGWDRLDYLSDRGRLEEYHRNYPDFAPVVPLLARLDSTRS